MAEPERDQSTDGALPVDPSLLDPSTGLFAQPFFLATLSWRVIACRRVLRPLAFVLLEVVDGVPDGPIVPSDPKVVAAMVNGTLRNSDVCARLADGVAAVYTPKDFELTKIMHDLVDLAVIHRQRQ